MCSLGLMVAINASAIDFPHHTRWKIGFFAKEYAKKEYDEFTTAYKNLGEKIRPGIYDFGFMTK